LTGISASIALAAMVFGTTENGMAQAISKAVKSPQSALLTGKVVSPDGSPIAKDKVIIFPADPPSGDPALWYPVTIGSAMTNTAGSWSFKMPAYRSLPAGSQGAADVNGGWLNVIASAFGVATVGKRTYEEEADWATSVWVGTGTVSSPPAGMTAPAALTMTMTPLQKDISSMTSEKGAEGTWAARASVMNTSDAYVTPPTDQYGYQPAISPDPEPGYSPYVAPGGVNLAHVRVTPGAADKLPKKCRDDDTDWKVEAKTLHKGWAWTKVGEYHTNWKATGGFQYTVGATTSISVEVSADGVHFGAKGSKTYHNDASDTLSVTQGPRDSHQVDISVKYKERARIDYPCVPGTSTCYPKVICAAHYWVEQTGLYNPGHGWVFLKKGANVHKYDGYNAFLLYANQTYWNGFHPGFGYSVTTGHGINYSYGASVTLGLISVSVESETDHNTDANQSISMNSGRRFDQIRNERSDLHEVWGSNHKLTNTPGPAVFYTY
jgi:hypothetical protein